nr:hypothetical protein [Rhodococcus ruber]
MTVIDLPARVGNSPLVRILTPVPTRHPGYFAKIEALGLGGLKARSALSMLVGARRRGELRAARGSSNRPAALWESGWHTWHSHSATP